MEIASQKSMSAEPTYPPERDPSEKGPQDAAKQDLGRLGPYVFSGWSAARDHRRESGIDDELLACLQQAKSQYSAAEKANIAATKAPEVYIPHSDTKRRTACAWAAEIFLNSSERNFVFRPTPVPEVSPDDALNLAGRVLDDWQAYVASVLAEQMPMEEAEAIASSIPPDPAVVKSYAEKRRDEYQNVKKEESLRKVKRMEDKCRDQIIEGGWMKAMNDLVDSCATYGTGILKGPILRNRKRTRFTANGVELRNVDVWEWESVPVRDAYPAKGAVEIGDGDFFQIVRYTPKALKAMARLGKEQGYYPDAINKILAMYPNGGLKIERENETEFKQLENDGAVGLSVRPTVIEGVEFWGDVRGSMLIELGMSELKQGGGKVEPDEYYEVNAIVIDHEAVFCSVSDEKLGRPLFKGTFYKATGSWWGESPMLKMRDLQKMYNSAARDLCVNMAQSAGPTGVLGDVRRQLPGTELQLVPWRLIAFQDPERRGDIPIKLLQPASNADELMAVMDRLEKQMDTVTGIPAYSHGSDIAAGAGRTASGLTMLLAAATRGMKHVIHSLSFDVLVPCLRYQYRVNMLFDEDEGIKGDVEVDVGGILAVLSRDQSIERLTSFIQMAQNPSVLAVIGETGLSELLRQYVSLLEGVNPDAIVPSKDEMERRSRLQAIEARVQQARQVSAEAGPAPYGGPGAEGAAQGMAQITSPNSRALMAPEGAGGGRIGRRRQAMQEVG